MKNAEIIEGLNMIIKGITSLRDALADGEVQTTEPVHEESEGAMNVPVADASAGADSVGIKTIEELKHMKYNEFKKYASSLGVKCTGSRDEILARIIALNGADAPVSGDAEEEVPEEEVVEEKKPVKSSRKLSKKDEAPVKDEFDEQAEAIAKDTPVEDIIESLASVDVKATKKNAVSKLAEALRNGLIEIDDSDEEEESDDSEDDGEEIGAESYFPEYDPDGFNNPEDMSDDRREAIVSKMDEVLTDISEGNLSSEDIEQYIEEHATQKEIDLLGDEYTEDDLVKMYMELIKRTIDNDGEEHESEDPYEIGDHNMCCGHELKYMKRTKKYVCEVCGAEYEAE